MVGECGSRRRKIIAQAAVKVLGFAHVDGISPGVFHDINAWFVRSFPPEFFQGWLLAVCHAGIMPYEARNGTAETYCITATWLA